MTLGTPPSSRRTHRDRRVTPIWALFYYLSAAPLVVTQSVQIAYIVIGAAWRADGRRPDDLDSVFALSPGWPPFPVPTVVFLGMALVISVTAIDLVWRPGVTPSGSRPGSMAALWGAGAVLVALHVWGFEAGAAESFVGFAAAVLMGISAVGALLALFRREYGSRRAGADDEREMPMPMPMPMPMQMQMQMPMPRRDRSAAPVRRRR